MSNNIRSSKDRGVERQTYVSNIDNYELEKMDEMELFAVIDSAFIARINLNLEINDFPKMK